MKKFAVLVATLMLAAGAALGAPAAQKAASKARVFRGEIWDQTCAKRGSHVAMAKEAGIAEGPNMARDCTLECANMGSPLVLYNPSNRHIYKLDDPEKAKAFAGEKVQITGTLDTGTGTIHIESVAAAH